MIRTVSKMKGYRTLSNNINNTLSERDKIVKKFTLFFKR